MRYEAGTLLSLVSSGMEICWIYAWASFSMTAILGRAVSFPILAVVFGFRCNPHPFFRRPRVESDKPCRSPCPWLWLGSFFRSPLFHYSSYPFFSAVWIALLFKASRTPLEWVHLVLINIWIGLLWFGGATLAKREKTYFNTCTRFDIGLAAFFVLLLTKLALRVKGGISTDDHVSSMLIYPYLFLSLMAISMARDGREGSKHFLQGRSGLGILMSIVSFVLLSASGLVFFLIPIFTQVGQGTGQQVLKFCRFLDTPGLRGNRRNSFYVHGRTDQTRSSIRIVPERE